MELFDPHEPFDCPQTYLDEYGDSWSGPPCTCPDYAPLDEKTDTDEAIEHVRKAYAGTLTMSDRWLGLLFDRMDRYDMWQDTAVILTSDHGYLLGEHGYWAKNYMLCYEKLTHLPLIVCHPKATSGRRQALTGAMDMMPSILDLHEVEEIPESVMGKSIVPLLRSDQDHHDALLFGYFGREVGLTDGRYTYHRMPAPGSVSHYHFTDYNLAGPHAVKEAAFGPHLKWCKGIPHFRAEQFSSKPRFRGDDHVIYDLHTDPRQEHPIVDAGLERDLTEKMKTLLQRADAPECQFQRLAL